MVKSAANDVKEMNKQIQKYGSMRINNTRILRINGPADNPSQSSGMASKTDGGFIDATRQNRNGTWEVGNWGDTLKFE